MCAPFHLEHSQCVDKLICFHVADFDSLVILCLIRHSGGRLSPPVAKLVEE